MTDTTDSNLSNTTAGEREESSRPAPGSASLPRRPDYCLHGFSFATREERQAAAVGHPLWKEYLRWDARRHCGTPDMDDDHDREVFEAFIHGAYLEWEAGRATPNGALTGGGGAQ